ncbi:MULTISPECIES: uroporphyrinogen-III C-methyltransferase [unclassified Fusibacter]|uniref:uroporphyrinogen-III C-methyltransferase n=1 Tax=unclassified Fusibacter TaxID=2624464 RepID=UPI00101370BB|nr:MULTISPECIES: uroporphyrinogen-III C-methyltransferase [unclassified Fusibacter]MCK8060521.1 uroporphyrinogen-III C-methyltransferase [Fusibacter sp. A2]NPE20190.1 uroporphyrinogen-III C-methyltransferase [Fusibacter sp. A1]RXV63400.1 uroporphyrinogen-III C-methyltransferase [Fusibacter sp. A1]
MNPKVYLVGAGCGDPELITVKGKRLLEMCDAVVYDRLANPELLALVSDSAVKIYVGKEAANHALTQDEINQLLVDLAGSHKHIVRLKGGDPYVFGRGGEEGVKLRENKIDFEVVPGITSAIGGLAYAGIPITHRSYASSFHVITGHLKEDELDHDWAAIAKYEGTLVFLMGLSNLERITGHLMGGGKDPSTPVALVQWASHNKQKKLIGTLEDITQKNRSAGLSSPCLIAVGEVINAHDTLDWFTSKPLFGRTVAVTRARDQASDLVFKLKALGASAVEVPTIKIVPRNEEALEVKLNSLKEYTHLVFTSQNGVKYFFEGLKRVGKDTRALGDMKIIAIGSQTAGALEHHGVIADLVPSVYVTEALVDLLKPQLKSADKLLVARAMNARKELITGLGSLCEVEEILIYESVAEELNEDQIEALSICDAITFTSASTVKHFFNQLGDKALDYLSSKKVVAIGPVTGDTLKGFGFKAFDMPGTYTIDGMVDRLSQLFEVEK